VLTFPNFCYRGNKGRSFVNLNEAVKLCTHENPLYRKIFGHSSYMSQITANFVLKFPNLRYYGNKGHAVVHLNVGIKLRDP